MEIKWNEMKWEEKKRWKQKKWKVMIWEEKEEISSWIISVKMLILSVTCNNSVHIICHLKIQIFPKFWTKRKLEVDLLKRITTSFHCIKIVYYICIYDHCLHCNILFFLFFSVIFLIYFLQFLLFVFVTYFHELVKHRKLKAKRSD